MIERIIIAGAGGQGIMFAGKLLAQAAMNEGKFVTYLPAYGAEVRGGTANCTVVVSDAPIGSPFVVQADSLVIMNQPSLDKFEPLLKPSGILVLNSSLAEYKPNKQIRLAAYTFTDIAVRVGSFKSANMVALGCFIAQTKLISIQTVIELNRASADGDKKAVQELNIKALLAGYELTQER